MKFEEGRGEEVEMALTEESVFGQGLKDSGRSDEVRQSSGESGRKHTHSDEWGDSTDVL